MSGFTGNSLIVSLNSIVGNTETLGKKNWRENKIYCLPGEYWFSLHNQRDNTETLGKTNWRENKICCLPREYWLSVHNLRDNALCITVRKPVWLVRFMSTSIRVKGLRDRMTFKYFLHFFSRLRSASRFSMFWVTFTALFFFWPKLLLRVKTICKTVVVKRERLKKTVKWDKMWPCMITALYTTVSLVLKTIVMAYKESRDHV